MTKEKKAIDDLFALTHINGYIDLYTQREVKIHTLVLSKWQKGVKVLLKLIDKQQKEIEELNNLHYDLGRNFIDLDIKCKQQQKYIEELKDEQEKEKNKDMSCDLTETRADNIDESTMLKQIKLKLQEKNIPIETLLAEFERLEDLEDDLTTVYLNGVYDGEKKVKDKIKAILKKYGKKEIEYAPDFYKEIQSLLEEE